MRKFEFAARCQEVKTFLSQYEQSKSDRMIQKNSKKFCVGVIFWRKFPEKSIFDLLQITTVYKNGPRIILIYYSSNESLWNLQQKFENIWGLGRKLVKFRFKVLVSKKWVICDSFILTPLKSFFLPESPKIQVLYKTDGFNDHY